MNNKKPLENFQVIITSGTDARKKPVCFNIRKRTLVIIIAVFFLSIAASLIISATAFMQISDSRKQIQDLTQKMENQSKLLDEYAGETASLQKSLQDGGSRAFSNPVSRSAPNVSEYQSGRQPFITSEPGGDTTREPGQSAEAADKSSAEINAQTEEGGTSGQTLQQSAGETGQSFSGYLAQAKILDDKDLDYLVWPFQGPDSGYDTDWPGPDGYYHAPRDGGQIHEGVDICAPHKTSVSAVTDGTVVSNGWNNDGGWMVEIRSPQGYTFRYLHLADQSSLDMGTSVQAGITVIGYCGNTGGDYPNHLHLSIYLPDSEGTADPTPYLKAAEERFISGE